MNNIFDYRPELEKMRQRQIEAARDIYEKCTDGNVYQPVLTSHEGELNKFYLYVTYRCPFHCSFCFTEGGERISDELSPERLFEISEQAADAGFRGIVVIGGEPLVYPGFDELLDCFENMDKKNSRLILRSTLAFNIAEDKLKRLCRIFDEITVSIDGTEAYHDSIRGKGSYGRIVDNLKKVLTIGGCQAGVNTVLPKELFEGEEGRSVIRLTDELGISKLTISSPHPLGRAEGTRTSLYKWVKGKNRMAPPEMRFNCGLGHNLYMQPDGKVFPCYAWCEPEHLLGKLDKEDVASVLERGGLLSYANTGVDTNEKCRFCKVRYFCGGKCKIYVKDKINVNSGDFDCASTKANYLRMLNKAHIIEC